MNKRAVALISCGLDSLLAAKIAKDQGAEIAGLHFEHCFLPEHKSTLKRVSEEIGISIAVRNVSNEIIALLENPAHGFGANINPCIDCRIMSFKIAGEYMKEVNASFIITGEVIGQRPMSQNRQALSLIERESELEGKILRPLSALLLKPTEPEKAGMVDREKLFGFKGRTRKPQLELARHLGLTEWQTPAGGCLLTDPGFSSRLKTVMEMGLAINENMVEVVKSGRLFRLQGSTILIIGRNQRENLELEKLIVAGDIVFWPEDVPGPTALLRGKSVKNNIALARQMLARYTDVAPGQKRHGCQKNVSTGEVDKFEFRKYLITRTTGRNKGLAYTLNFKS